MSFKKRNFINLSEVNKKDIIAILDRAKELKKTRNNSKFKNTLNKTSYLNYKFKSFVCLKTIFYKKVSQVIVLCFNLFAILFLVFCSFLGIY